MKDVYKRQERRIGDNCGHIKLLELRPRTNNRKHPTVWTVVTKSSEQYNTQTSIYLIRFDFAGGLISICIKRIFLSGFGIGGHSLLITDLVVERKTRNLPADVC